MSTATERDVPSWPTSVRFPGEGSGYRAARDELLRAEAGLRSKIEEVAKLRRSLPEGGAVPQDYVFEEGGADLDDTRTVAKVKLSELFVREESSLILYSFMYGPSMDEPCPMCTSMLDGLNGAAPHISQRINLAIVARSPIERIRAYARLRGWRNLRLLSSAGNSYHRDYHGEAPDGSQVPMLNVFSRSDGSTRHFYATELVFAGSEPGQNARHIDLLWPVWNVFDLTREGRGTDWYPRLSYD